MGLELVELVLAVEESFGIDIPDEDAQRLGTPNQLVEYLVSRLDVAGGSLCLSQRAFYRVRRGLEAEGLAARRELGARSPLEPLFPRQDRKRKWPAFGRRLGLSLPDLRRPVLLGAAGAVVVLGATALAFSEGGRLGAIVALPASAWFFLAATRWAKVRLPFERVDQLVEHLTTRHAQALLEPGESWNEEQIRATTFALTREQLGLRDFDPDGDFVRDLKLD